MGEIIDLDRERRINAYIDELGGLLAGDPQLADRTFQHLEGKIPAMAETERVNLAIRITPSMKTRLDELTTKLNQTPEFMESRSGTVKRAAIIREALLIGVTKLEKRVG